MDWKKLLRRALLLAIGAAGGATLPSPLPSTPPPSAPPVVVAARAVAFTVWQRPGLALSAGAVRIVTDEPRELPCGIRADGGWTCAVPADVPVPYGATLRIEADGLQPLSQRLELEAAIRDGLGDIVLAAIPPPPAAVQAREAGWLHRDGVTIRTESGAVWRYAGYSAFPLLQKSCGGENVGPFVDEAITVGANTLRVLGMFDGGLGSFRLALEGGRYDTCVLELVRYLQAKGVRIQFVVFADAQNVLADAGAQRALVARLAALLKDEWNVIGELCNECAKNGVDPAGFAKPNVRTLWSRGSGLGGGDPAFPAWDLADYHEARDGEYPRKNECRPYMDDGNSPIKGTPCLQSEPMGASEVDQPGKRAGDRGDGGAQAISDFRQMGANFGLQGPGGLFHSDAGLAGGLLGPIQRQMAIAFFEGLHFAPAEAYTWTYQRGNNCGDCDGVGGMPLEQRDLPDPQGTLRTFCRGTGTREWCLEVRRTGGHPVARAGWSVAESRGGLVRLTR